MNTKIQRAEHACFHWAYDWGGVKNAPEPTPKEILRAIAAKGWSGHRRTVACVTNLRLYANVGSFALARPARVVDHGDGCRGGYGSIQMLNVARAERLVGRYQRFHSYMTETRHAWQFVRDVYYADNSTEREERSVLTGQVRRRQITAPSGDLCF